MYKIEIKPPSPILGKIERYYQNVFLLGLGVTKMFCREEEQEQEQEDANDDDDYDDDNDGNCSTKIYLNSNQAQYTKEDF